MGAKYRLLKPKGQEQEREHIQQKKTIMLSEFWLHFDIVIIFVMTSFSILIYGQSMTLNPAIQNIATAHRLRLVNICVRFLRNTSRALRVTERKGNC